MDMVTLMMALPVLGMVAMVVVMMVMVVVVACLLCKHKDLSWDLWNPHKKLSIVGGHL